MEAKYPSDCTRCGQRIEVGDDQERSDDGWHHVTCPGQSTDDHVSDDQRVVEETSTGSTHAPTSANALSAEEQIRSNLEREIKAAREAAAKKLAALKRQQAKLDAVIDAEVLALLKTDHPDMHAQLVGRAKQVVDARARERSDRAKVARAKRAASG